MVKLLKTIGTFFVSFLLVILVVEFTLSMFIAKGSEHRGAKKMTLLFHKVNNNSVVIAGPSRTEWGIRPLLLDSVFTANGMENNAVNLAFPASNAIDVINFLVEHDKYPKLLVVPFHSLQHEQAGVEFEPVRNYHWIDRGEFLVYDWIRRNSFLFENDWKSLKTYADGGAPYFRSHKYDASGGVRVREAGDYTYRRNAQLKYVGEKIPEYNQDEAAQYARDLKASIQKMRNNGTRVLLMRMPICKELKDFENKEYPQQLFCELEGDFRLDLLFQSQCGNPIDDSGFAKYIGATELTEGQEKIFMDGSHLTHESADEFSRLFGTTLIELLNKP